MIQTCYIDTNVFLYLEDEESLFFNICNSVIKHCKANNIRIVTSTETFQEIIYLAQNTKQLLKGIKAANYVMGLVNIITPIDKEIISLYLKLIEKYKNIRSRDILHLSASIMTQADVTITYDKDFKKFKEIKSITPEEFLKKK